VKPYTTALLRVVFADIILLVVITTLPARSQETTGNQPPPCPEERSAANLISAILNEEGPEAAERRFVELLADRDGRYCIDEKQFNNLGYELLYSVRAEDAVTVFRMNVSAFPTSTNVHHSLGEGYEHLFDADQARVCYEKALQLDPGNTQVQWSLQTVDQNIADLTGETEELTRFNPGESTGLQGDYFRQRPPGQRGEVFAPGIISTHRAFEFGPTFSSDGKEMYFRRRGASWGFMICRWEEEGWTAPEPMSDMRRAFEGHITPDGKRMFYGLGPEIWYRDRTAEGWGEPVLHGNGMFASTTKEGTLYVTDISNPEQVEIVRQRLVDGKYGEPEKISETMNGPNFGAHPCIAPDERFLLFDSRPVNDKYGDADFYLCFRQKDGAWGEPIRLGDQINTDGEDICMSISPDGKYLFYTSRRDIYWVSSEIIRDLAPDSSR
jgi:hypothetical protein